MGPFINMTENDTSFSTLRIYILSLGTATKNLKLECFHNYFVNDDTFFTFSKLSEICFKGESRGCENESVNTV